MGVCWWLIFSSSRISNFVRSPTLFSVVAMLSTQTFTGVRVSPAVAQRVRRSSMSARAEESAAPVPVKSDNVKLVAFGGLGSDKVASAYLSGPANYGRVLCASPRPLQRSDSALLASTRWA